MKLLFSNENVRQKVWYKVYEHNGNKFSIDIRMYNGNGKCELCKMDSDGIFRFVADKAIVNAPYKNNYFTDDVRHDTENKKIFEDCERVFLNFIKAIY